MLSFSPFAVQNTGIIPAQTLLKLDTYAIACIPWQFGFQRGILAASFSRDELAFFQRFKSSLAGLALAFQRPDQPEPTKIFCRCQVSAIGAMKGREELGLIVLDWKPIPPPLADILKEQLALAQRLELRRLSLKGLAVPVKPDTAKRLGYNNFAVMKVEGEQRKLALFSIAVDRLDFLMPLNVPDVAPGTAVSFTLYFLKYRFSTPGTVISSSRLPTGVQRVIASIEPPLELVHLLDDYFTREGARAQ
jgi:hypothetical protein